MTIVDHREHSGTERTPEDEPGDHSVPPPARAPTRLSRLRQQAAERIWPTVVLFLVLAATATLTNSPGWYVGDNRFEQYWNPARRVAKSFTIWDGSRGFGRVREDFWPGTTLPVAALRGIGASPILAEHLWHALVLAMAGVGMVLVVRLFRPRIGLEHIIAGLVFAFGSFSATFLLPSNLSYHFALAPYLFVVAFRGVHSERPWRWAAIFALLTFSPGNVDTPGLVYNCVPLIPLAVFLVFVERSVRLRNLLAWFGRALVLSLGVNAIALVKTYFAAAALGQRLNDTEAADIAALTSSWPESLRGLGNWLSYYAEGGQLLKPQGEPYFTNWVVVAFTFVPPCVALFVLWQSRWRTRLMYVMVMLASLVILVGAFPRGNSSPLGKQILNAYTNFKILTAFRNTYKIGAGVVIGIAALFAYGVILAYRSMRRRNPKFRFIPILLAFVTIAVTAFPFWTGHLYDPANRFEAVPEYWTQSFAYLDALPPGGRSLILPQTSRTQYRWGWVGDDIFDALMSRPHAIATGVPLSTPIGANALEAITLAANDPVNRPGVLAAMARRLGITEIVLRNDVDWQEMRRPRPAAFDGVRHDPEFEKEATFGAPGENTTNPHDAGPFVDYERTLPPVEVYRLKAPADQLRVTNTPALLTSGDATGWIALAQAGLLSGDAPIAYTASSDPAEMTTMLQHGSPLVITDSNRRRLRVLLSYEADYSYLLGPTQDLDRQTQSLWPQEGTQSVAWWPDATKVSASGIPRTLSGSEVWNRPSQVFDGNPDTAWKIHRLDQPLDHYLHVDLRDPQDVSGATITLPSTTPKGEGIRKGALRFSDGSEEEFDLTSGSQHHDFTAHHTSWIEFRLKDVAETSLVDGVAEMTFFVPDGSGTKPLDLHEFVQTPDDIFRAAQNDPQLTAAIQQAATDYVFQRSQRTTSQLIVSALGSVEDTDEEVAIRRRFETSGTKDYDVSGALRVRNDTSDDLISQLIGGDVRATGSHRAATTTGGNLAGWGGFAVDGDPDSAWYAPAKGNESLTLHFPTRPVRQVSFTSKYDGQSAKITSVDITVGDHVYENVQLAVLPDDKVKDDKGNDKYKCDDVVTQAPVGCRRTLSFDVPSADVTSTDHVTIRVHDVEGEETQIGARVRIDEAQINGVANPRLALDTPLARECVDLGMTIETATGVSEPVVVQIEGTRGDLLTGKPLTFTSCAPVTLEPGWHLLDAGGVSPVDRLMLRSQGQPDLTPPPSDAPPSTAAPASLHVGVVEQTSTLVHLTGTNQTAGTTLVFDQSWDPGWRAFVNGKPIGEPQALDAMNAWTIDATGDVDIELRYNPQQLFTSSIVVTGVSLAFCGWLILRRPRRRRRTAGVADE